MTNQGCEPASAFGGGSEEAVAREMAELREANARMAQELAEVRRRLARFEIEVARRLAILDDDALALARASGTQPS